MKTALVTGSRGFIGHGFTQRLTELEYRVTEVDIAAPIYWNALDLFTTRRVQYDLVVHAAAYSPHRVAIDSEHDLIVRNTELDAAMFRWAIETRQPNVIYFSSSAVYSDDVRHPILGGRMMDMAGVPFGFIESQGRSGEPFDAYGVTKRHGEAMAAAAITSGVNVTVLRPFSGYGSTQTEKFPFGAFIHRALRREDPFIIWGDAEQARDFVHLDDIIATALTLNENRIHVPVNVCTGVATTMRELATLIIETLNTLMPLTNYRPYISVDPDAPMGVRNRVGDPALMRAWHSAQVTVREGVERALKDLTQGVKA